MRHRKHHGGLGLVSGHRRALLTNLATALLTHGRIETTEAKARAMRPYVEKLITLGKRGDLHARRQALSELRARPVVDLLFGDVASSFSDREGGYTRMIKTGFRNGDAAPMAVVELVQEKVNPKKKAKKAKPVAKKAEAKPVEAEETKVEAAADATTEDAPVEAAGEAPVEEEAAAAEEAKAEEATEEVAAEAAPEASAAEAKAEEAKPEESEAAPEAPAAEAEEAKKDE